MEHERRKRIQEESVRANSQITNHHEKAHNFFKFDGTKT
jgi:hypothetical protein